MWKPAYRASTFYYMQSEYKIAITILSVRTVIVYRFFTCFAISLVGSIASILAAHSLAAALFCFTLNS